MANEELDLINNVETNELSQIGSLYLSRKHPLVSWISTILSVFSGTILANWLLNEPVVSAFGNTQQVIWASLIWYLVYYSPFDIVFKLINSLPIKLVLFCLEEVYNSKVIYQGIIHASRVFPDSYVVMGFIGIVKGNGPCFIKIMESFMRGAWPTNYQYSTKVTILVTIVFIVNRFSEWLMISQPFMLFCVASSSIYLRMSALLMDLTDPFAPIESILCMILFGGIWDALARAMSLDDHSQQNRMKARPLKADILISKSARAPVEVKVGQMAQPIPFTTQSQ